jgi:hypothetical protein
MLMPGRRFALALTFLLCAGVAKAAEFDRIISVPRGTRLDVRLFAGEVVVRAWDRDSIRVRATHFTSDEIDVRTLGQAITVRARARRGAPHGIDFDIDVPAWMAVDVAGTYLDIAIDGTTANVTAETVRGDIHVKGGAGVLRLKSIDGEVVLESARGRAELSSTNDGIRVTGFTGELIADTVNGSVKLRAIQATSVEVGTFGGDISWEGTFSDDGRYRFATHTGGVDVSLDSRVNATVNVRAFEGVFRAAFPVKLPDEASRHRRFSFVLGSGSARLDLETFGGTISLRRPQLAAR